MLLLHIFIVASWWISHKGVLLVQSNSTITKTSPLIERWTITSEEESTCSLQVVACYDKESHNGSYVVSLTRGSKWSKSVEKVNLIQLLPPARWSQIINGPLLLLVFVTCYIRFGQIYPNFTVFYHRLQSYKCGKSAHFHAKGFVLNTRIKCGPWTQQQYQYRRHSRAIGDGNIKTDETITKSSESEL